MVTEKQENLIYFDDLTGFFNRRYLYSWLPKELEEAHAENRKVWLFMLDVDNFKMINDTYGHLSGDQIIKDVSLILKENTKTDDKRIRYAGDEFTIIIREAESVDILKIAERVVNKINSFRFKEMHSGKEIHITVSVGIAGFPQDTTTHMELINLADKALYVSKLKGKNCVSTVSEITPDLLWKKDFLERFPCQVLAGRQNELIKVDEAMKNATQFKPSFLLITGDLGIGKSRLLIEFSKLLRSQGVAVFSTRCADKSINQPFYVLGELLDSYLSSLDKLPSELLEDISAEEFAAMCNFMPLFKSLSAEFKTAEKLSPSLDSLSQALMKIFVNVSKQVVYCISLDDFQYIDADSLMVIQQIIKQDKVARILIVGAFSPGELVIEGIGDVPLTGIIKTGELDKICDIMTLQGLNEEEVTEMLSNIFINVPLTAEFSGLIYRKTKGNPLFVEELAKYFIENEIVYYKTGRWFLKDIEEQRLPSTVEDVIRSRLENLDSETKEMISKAAVIGRDFQVDLLQKIDSEDRGYVLDLIEGAKKIGLICDKGVTGEDEFSFVTGEIRNVLFKATDGEHIKQLYSRVGKVKEQLYSGNLNGIAGELFYNFKKAEDKVRAEQYAKIVKDGKAAFYDRTIKFAQDLLAESSREKLLLPLSKESLQIACGLVKSLYMAGVNYMLYPPQSKLRIQAIEEVYKKLSGLFEESEVITIAVVESNIIVNNKRLGKELQQHFAESFISVLDIANVDSITFNKGVDLRELTSLVGILNSQEAKDSNISDLLKREDISNIVTNEIVYDISRKKSKEKENLQEIMLMDYLLGRVPADGKKIDLPSAIVTHAHDIAQSLEKLGEEASKDSGRDKEVVKAEIMAKSIQKIGNELIDKKDDWKKYKEGLAKTLISIEPNLRAKVLSSSIESESNDKEKGKDNIDVIKELSSELPEEVVVDVLKRQYLQKDINIAKLRNMVDKFLPTQEKKDKIMPLLEKELKQVGATEDEFQWMMQDNPWKKLSLGEKVKKCSDLPMDALTKLLPMIKVDSLIKDLIKSGEDAQIELVWERFINALEEKQISKEIFVSSCKDILTVLLDDSADNLLPKFIFRLLKSCIEKEELIPVFIAIVNPCLDKIIDALLKTERLGLIKKLMQAYTKDSANQQYFTRAIEPAVSALIDELMKMIDLNSDWSELLDILFLLKEQVASRLIDRALFEKGVPQGKYFEAYLRKRTIGRILKKMINEKELAAVFKEKFNVSEVYLVKNLIEIIGAIESDETNKVLKIPLLHPDPAVRRKVIFTLGKIKGRESAKLLGEALLDEDAVLSKEALNILKNRKDEFAAQVLRIYHKEKDSLPDK